MSGIPQMRARSGMKAPDASEPPRLHDPRSTNTKLTPNAASSGSADHQEKPTASALPKARRSMLPFIGRKKLGDLPSAPSQSQLKTPPHAPSMPVTASSSISRSASVGKALLKAAAPPKDSAREASTPALSSSSPTLALAQSTSSSQPPVVPQMPSTSLGSKFAAHFAYTKSRRPRFRSTVAAENSQSTPPPTNTSSTHIANQSFESRRTSKDRMPGLHHVRNLPVAQREFPMEEYTDLFVVPFSELHGKPPQATKPPSKVAQVPTSPTTPSAPAGPSTSSASKPPAGIPSVIRTSQSSTERSSTRMSREPAFRGETASSLSKRTSGSIRLPRPSPSPTTPTAPVASAPAAGSSSARERSKTPPQAERPETRTAAARKAPSPAPSASGPPGSTSASTSASASKGSLKRPFISRRPSSFQNLAPSKPPSAPLPSPPLSGSTLSPGSAGAPQAATPLHGSVGPSSSRNTAARSRPRASTISSPVDACKENARETTTTATMVPTVSRSATLAISSSTTPSASSSPSNAPASSGGASLAGRPAVDFDPLSCLTVDEMRRLIHRQRMRHNELQESIVRITKRHADEKTAMMKTIDELQRDMRRQTHEIEGLRELVFSKGGIDDIDAAAALARSSQRDRDASASPHSKFDFIGRASPTRLQPRSRGNSPQRAPTAALNAGLSVERLRLDMEYLDKTEPALLQPHHFPQDAAPSSGASASSRSPISTAGLTLTPTTTSSVLDSIPEAPPPPPPPQVAAAHELPKVTRAERAKAREERRESRARCEYFAKAPGETHEEPRASHERVEISRKSVDDALQKLRLFG